MSERRWVGPQEAARMLGVSRQRVFQLGLAGALRRKRDPDAFRWLYAEADVVARAVAMLSKPSR